MQGRAMLFQVPAKQEMLSLHSTLSKIHWGYYCIFFLKIRGIIYLYIQMNMSKLQSRNVQIKIIKTAVWCLIANERKTTTFSGTSTAILQLHTPHTYKVTLGRWKKILIVWMHLFNIWQESDPSDLPAWTIPPLVWQKKIVKKNL